MRLCNFQSFGPEPTKITFEDMTFLIGPNGSGKTAVLQGLCRMFSFDPKDRRIQRSDFHVPNEETRQPVSVSRSLWLEVDFEFPELEDEEGEFPSIPPNFSHMRLESADGVPRVRFRLEATLDSDGEVEDLLNYVLEIDANGQPVKQSRVPKLDRNGIHIHYLPARRDPSDHISYATNSLLGRVLRSINWKEAHEGIVALTEQISDQLSDNPAVEGFSDELTTYWKGLHTGEFYADPEISFLRNEMDTLLRHLSVGFSPGHNENSVDFSRLSDGQKSLLYLSLVLAAHGIGRKVLKGEFDSFNVEKLRPAIFTFIAMEEPENSLSPHYLGRIIKSLSEFSNSDDSQAAIATHAPSLLKRVDPKDIRYLRLGEQRVSEVKTIALPDDADDAHKFVREAVRAYPEIYFSRLVILGEGDSEEIVLPRLMEAHGLGVDLASISVAPLGGRHVNHFWRLLRGLEIPFLTLLDLDLGRHQGGWGRIRYAIGQLLKFPPAGSKLTKEQLQGLPKWNDASRLLESENGPKWIAYLESLGVFFSTPLDLDFMMLQAFPGAYQLDDTELEDPSESITASVLGEHHHDADQYAEDDQKQFSAYVSRFKQGSKPVAHIEATAELSDEELNQEIPGSINRLINAASKILEDSKE
jgi:putative ATP-dependent endonuclease of OLD family